MMQNELITHLEAGKNNQDRVLALETENGVAIFAVADGSDDGNGAFAAECLIDSVQGTVKSPGFARSNREFNQMVRDSALKLLDNHEKNSDKMAFCAYTLARVFPDGLMEVSYLGDVKLSVFRDGEVMYQTTEYSDPDTQWLTKGLKVGDMIGQDIPDFTEIVYDTFQLEKGDVVICASDGLWDNRRPEEIAKMLVLDPNASIESIKDTLATIPHDRKSYQDDRGVVVYRY